MWISRCLRDISILIFSFSPSFFFIFKYSQKNGKENGLILLSLSLSLAPTSHQSSAIAMAAIAKLQISVQSFYHPSSIDFSSIPNRNSSPFSYSGRNPRRRDGVSSYRWWKHRHFLAPMRRRSFRSEEEKTGRAPLKRKGPLYSLKSLILKVSGLPSQSGGGEYRKAAVEKAEEIFFSVRH